MELALHIDGVSKLYPGRNSRLIALDAVSLSVAAGSAVGLVGPNGAGKSTMLRLTAGLCRPDTGSISVLGARPGTTAVLTRLGYCPEIPLLPPYLTVGEFLRACAKLLGLTSGAAERRLERLEVLEIRALKEKLIRTLSKGQRQRVNLVQAMLGEPDLLLLDEPFNGLDPSLQKRMRELVREGAAGRTVLITSHQLDEVEHLCERVFMMVDGRVANVLDVATERRLRATVVFSFPATALPDWAQGAEVLPDGRLRCRLQQADLGAWLSRLVKAGGTVHTVEEGSRRLEDVYESTLAARKVGG